MIFTNKIYDTMKWIAQYLLPASATLYFAIAQLWNLPYAEQIVGTITAIDAFLGILLGISSAGYSGDGRFIVDKSDPEKDIYRIEYDNDLDVIENKKTVTLKIDRKD